MAFLSAHLARDDYEAHRDQRTRDASAILSLAILLAGKEQSRREVADHLAKLARGEDGAPTPGTSLEDLKAKERDYFLDLDPLWQGAIPDPPEMPDWEDEQWLTELSG